MSEEVLDSTANAGEGQRPVFLTVLCILSFVFAGLAFLGYIAIFTVMGAATAALANMEGAVQAAGPSVGMTWAYLIVSLIMTIVGLVGVIKMWKLNKSGFTLYAGSSVVSVIMGIIYAGFSVMSVVFPIAFIAMYYVNLKAMK